MTNKSTKDEALHNARVLIHALTGPDDAIAVATLDNIDAALANTNDDLKTIIRQMFSAWVLFENSWNDQKKDYTRSSESCFLEITKGDKIRAALLELFCHWYNDIQDQAAHLGIGLKHTGPKDSGPLIIFDVPPPPSIDAWWDTRENRWRTD